MPLGFDAAFDSPVLNTAPAQDYTSGSIPGSPDHPDWPAASRDVVIQSTDGALVTGKLALHPGTHPGVVVVHAFNTNGKESVVRWAAMLARNGFNVLAADQRDFKAESDAGYGSRGRGKRSAGGRGRPRGRALPRRAAGRLEHRARRLQPGRTGHRARPRARRKRVFSAGLNFSGPADQATQVDSTAVPSGCETQRGEHAYFFDRWWQQRAILLYFKNLLPGAAADPTIETGAAVGQTAGGAPAGAQRGDPGAPTRADADARRGPDPGGTARGAPGTAMP